MLCCIAMTIIRDIQRLFFSKVTVLRGKYCLEISKVRERLKNLGVTFLINVQLLKSSNFQTDQQFFNVETFECDEKAT